VRFPLLPAEIYREVPPKAASAILLDGLLAALGLSGNAAKHSIFRAVQKLRRALEPLVQS
jgi:hypothetical protein